MGTFCREEDLLLSKINDDEVVNFLSELIQYNSSYPPGDTRKIAQFCQNKLSEFDIDAKIFTSPPDVKSAIGDNFDSSNYQSVIATIGEGDHILTLHSHIDTVSAGNLNDWQEDPFAGKIIDGKIYGRGAGDDKGSVTAQVMATIAIKRSDYLLNGKIQLVLAADEEASSNRGTRWLRDSGLIDPEFLIIGEQTNNNICTVERAILWLSITIYGKSAHGAMPWEGNNAVIHMCNFVDRLNNEVIPLYHKEFDSSIPFSTISMTKIRGGEKTNIIPGDCSLDVDCRLAYAKDAETILDHMVKILQEESNKKKKFVWIINKLQHDGTPIQTNEDASIVNVMSQVCQDVTNNKAVTNWYKQASDGRLFSNKGIPIIIFGPGDPALGHSPNEYVTKKQLVEATKIYALTATRLFK